MAVVIPLAPFMGTRLRARRVDEVAFATAVAEEAIEHNAWRCRVTHGGGVANAYEYPAQTECVLALSNPLGVCVFWTGRAAANKVTPRSASSACIMGVEDLFDNRVKSEERKNQALEYLQWLYEQKVPPLVILAACA